MPGTYLRSVKEKLFQVILIYTGLLGSHLCSSSDLENDDEQLGLSDKVHNSMNFSLSSQVKKSKYEY